MPKANTFELRINLDNDAFADNCSYEIARILREAADLIEDQYAVNGTLRDINGNTVGFFRPGKEYP